MARVLVIEPFLGGSHHAWAAGWRDHSRHAVEIIGHEDRHWRWRMRGGSVSLAREVNGRRADVPVPEVVVASNMLDLASFRGLTVLPGTRWVQYLHENQLSYPRQAGEAIDSGLAWMQWRGLLAADEVWCNSRFHLDELLGGLDQLLAGAPDHGHEQERAALDARLRVISPGVDLAACRADRRGVRERPLVLSNQRWHHDKDVGAVIRAVRRLVDDGLDIELAVIGDDRGGEADALHPRLDELGDRVVARGFQARSRYLELLRRADIVVSAARGENFGIAVVEAIAAGGWPVVPNGLAYPEVIPPAYHPVTLYESGGLRRRLRATIAAVASRSPAIDGLAEAMTPFDVRAAAVAMDDRVDALVGV
ncbi:MAG: DUF3524 domain-containing protein [Actinomycetota bacterium]